MIRKYRKNPFTFEAIQWNGNNWKECEDFLEGNYDSTLNYPSVKIYHVPVEVASGWYICKDENKVFSIYPEEIFEGVFEEVTE